MLLDTSGLLCLYDKSEHRHPTARSLYQGVDRPITHSYVLAEFVALAHARGAPRSGFLAFVSMLLDAPEIEVIWVDEALHRAAVELLKRRLDKAYSLCDAVGFVMMRERGLTQALTTDRHFEQEGFIRLLES